MTYLRKGLLFTVISTGSILALAEPRPTLSVQLTPVIEQGITVALDVTETIVSEQPLPPLVIAKTLGPLQHIDERISALSANDTLGELKLLASSATRVDALGQLPRAWKTNRPSEGAVTLRYRVAVSTETTPGPTWELRVDARGISAAGNSFLLLPESDNAYQVSVNWQLDGLIANATALNSLPTDGIATPARIAASYFMAGDLSRLNGAGKTVQFRAASTLAPQKFSNTELLSWSHSSYQQFSDFFGFPELPPFTVMFRSNPLISKSGTELPDALMVAANNQIELANLHEILSHEMVHVFLHGLADASWFQEGLAVVYENRAPFALGLLDGDNYLDAVNTTLRTYYSNVKKTMPMVDATAAFWTDARARLQPYYRGALYFIVTDSRLRQIKKQQVTLDDLLRTFLEWHRQGKSVEVADWLTLVKSYLGDIAQQDFDALQNGGLLLPENDAFGTCYERKSLELPTFELGFDISSLMKKPLVIHGLDLQSPAATAGLREGDIITQSIGLDEQQSRLGEPMTLMVERAGKVQPISFIPTGKLTTGYQWVTKAETQGAQVCRH